MPLKKYTKCATCGKRFVPKTYRNIYCCRRCFYIDYRKKQKESDFPLYICPQCGKKTELNFFPKNATKKFDNFFCPHCGYKPIEENKE